MPISPDEISAKRFVVTLRGYDRSEVESFLRAVARDQSRLIRRVQELESLLSSIGPEAVGHHSAPGDSDHVLASVLEDAATQVSGFRARLRRRRSGEHRAAG